MTKEEFSKYERARILGARALQISMDAPIILKMKSEDLENINFDPLRIAEQELDSGILPISVNRPMPEKKKKNIEKIKISEEKSDEKKAELEKQEVEEIAEEGEIMEIANPEDESEEDIGSGLEGGGDGEE